MDSKKRKKISLSDKMKIVNAVARGEKQADIAKTMGLSKQTVSSIVNNKGIASKQVSGEINPKRFRLREATHPEVESALLMWLRDARARDIPVNGLMLRKRAEQLAVILGHNDVTFSDGWLERFKARHGVTFMQICGERNSVSVDAVAEWKENELPTFLARYDDKDIFNADESGLFYKAKPTKTYTVSGSRCHGGKRSKERLTVLFCCNMSGTEKVKLLFIGKSKQPRALRHVKNMPVDWTANTKAWMTKDLFNAWLLQFDRQMSKQKRKVLLFLDNCSSHMKPPQLEAVELAYFPPNATSVLQPIDQGVVHSVKAAYRTRLVERLLFDMSSSRESKIDVRFPVEVLASIWQQLKADVIKNCFRKAGFLRNSGTASEESCDVDEPSGPDDEPSVWPRIREAFGAESFSDFVSFDDCVVDNEELTDEDLRAAIEGRAELSSDNDSEQEGEPPKVKLTSQQVIDRIEEVKDYFQQQQDDCSVQVMQLIEMRRKVTASTLNGGRQSLITKFFSSQT